MGEKKITKKEFQVFEKEARKWADLYGLTDWDIQYRKTTFDDDKALATTDWEKDTFVAYIRLRDNTDENHIVDTPTLKEGGRHEIDHVLFGEITDMLYEFYSEDVAVRAVHRVIYRLENMRKKLGIA